MKKKLVSLLVMAMALATVFVGCGKKEESNETGSSANAEAAGSENAGNDAADLTSEDWTDGHLIINGGDVEIGKISLADFKAATGFTTEQVVIDNKTFKSYYLSDGNSTIRLYTTPDETVKYIYIDEKFGDTIDGVTYPFDSSKTTVVVPGGFTVGKSTIDETVEYYYSLEAATKDAIREDAGRGTADFSGVKREVKEDGSLGNYIMENNVMVTGYIDTRILCGFALQIGEYQVY